MEGQASPTKQEFFAGEKINFNKGESVTEGVVGKDDNTIKTSNVSLPTEELAEEPDASTHKGPLTFDPSPPLREDEEFQLATVDNQAKLM
jgi:hypothetical protein